MALEKITRTMRVSPSREKELQNREGGGNIGDYSNISDENFAGTNCGLPGAYPMDTMERARAALAYAHYAKNPDCIRKQVYKKWPSLDPDKK